MNTILTRLSLAIMVVGAIHCAEMNLTDPELKGKADGPCMREAAVSVDPGQKKTIRVKTDRFTASLTQDGEVPARLTAKHYALFFEGASSAQPTLDVVGDGDLHNWTIAVENLGQELLVGGLCVRALTPAGPEELGIISDIDKTILPPATGETLPPPYPGMAALLQLLELGAGGQPGDVYFVTARTPERVEGLEQWMATHGIPQGPIETGISGVPWVAQKEKVKDVTAILEAHPGQRFVLFGDSSHRDPEVYREIIAAYPDRIAVAVIHRVNNINPSRVQDLELVEHYAQAAAVLYQRNLLDEATAREVMSKARDEGLDITLETIDALIAQHRPPSSSDGLSDGGAGVSNDGGL